MEHLQVWRTFHYTTGDYKKWYPEEYVKRLEIKLKKVKIYIEDSLDCEKTETTGESIECLYDALEELEELDGKIMSKAELIKELEDKQKKVEELKKQIENMPDDVPVKRWRADLGEKFYYIDGVGDINFDYEDGSSSPLDTFHYNTGNYFKTGEQAQLHKENIINRQRLKDLAIELNNGVEIDWNDKRQEKWCIYLNDEGILFSHFNTVLKFESITFCLDRNFKDKAIELIGEDKLIQLIKDGE